MLEVCTLTCRDCGASFEFDQGRVDFFNGKGFEHYPTRCSPCSAQRRAQFMARPTYTITCEQCGNEAQVLHPDMKLCRDCHKASQSEG